MFTKESDSFRKFAIWVGRCSWLKEALRPLYEAYHNQLNRHQNHRFLRRGVAVLDEFDRCMTTNGHPYILVFGSNLGAIREHGFIKHDLDVDTAMWIEDYSPKVDEDLKRAGFTLEHELTVDGGKLGLEKTFSKNGVSIDIFFIYPPIDKHPYCCVFGVYQQDAVSFVDSMKKYGGLKVRRIQLPWTKDIVRVRFESLQLPVPKNSDEIMRDCYGDDYMTPQPKWVARETHDYATIWTEKKGIWENLK